MHARCHAAYASVPVHAIIAAAISASEPTVVNHNVTEVQAVRHVCCAIIMQSACILISPTYVRTYHT